MSASRIMVVEDKSIVGRDIQECLERLGYSVTCVVASGEESIEKAGQERPDAVLMDIHLRGEMDGIDAASGIYARFGIPVIFLTAYTDNELLDRAREIGSFGYLIKPFEQRELHAMIEMALYKAKTEAERKEVQEALEAERNKLNEYFENLPMSAYHITFDGRIADCNNVAVRTLGYSSKDELIGKVLVTTIYAPSSQEKAQLLFEKWKREHKLRNEELQVITKQGEILDVLLNEDTIIDHNGAPMHSLSTHLDITERKRAEEALRESEEKYRGVVENANEAIVVAQDGILESFNRKAVEITGYSGEELAGRPFSGLIYPDDRAMVTERHRARLKGEELEQVHPFRIIDKSGTVKWLEVNAVPTEWDDKPATLNFLTDITEKRQTEEEVAAAIEKAQRRGAETSALLEATRSVLECQTFEEAARRIFESCKKLTGATAGYVAMLSADGAENEVLFLDAGGRPCAVGPDLPMPIRGLRAEAYRAGKSVYDNDFATSEWMKFIPAERVSLDNVIFAPLVIAGEEMGLLALANKPGGFTGDDARMATAFGELAAIALRNSRAEEEQVRLRTNLQALWHLARMVDVDLRDLCEYILAEIVERTESRYGFYGFLNEDESVMTLQAWSPEALKDCDIQDKTIEFSIDKAGVWDDAVRNRAPVVINDYERDHPGKKGVSDGHVSLRRIMVVPVFSKGRIVAVGAVANKETEYLDSDVEHIGGFMTSAQHILDRKRADDALHESEKRYGALFNGITDAVLVHHITDDGLPGDLIEVNDVACRMLGYTRDELLNMGIGDIDAAESTVDVRRTVEQLRSGQDVLSEQTHVKKDGTRIPVEVHSQTFTFKDRVAVLSTVRDITYRKRAEEERARLEEQLLQSQKMEAIGRLAGGIAHDFNNLLTAISGYSEILLSRLQEQDPMHMPINEIRKASTQAATLTRQLLTFSRKQSLKLEVMDLNAVLTDTAQMLRYVIGENIDLVTVPDPEAKTVRADSAQVAQVIMNLAVNARDAMPDGGNLTIRTANVSLGEGDTNRLALLRPGPYVMLEMADTGSGITPEIQSHIFEPFFTTKRVGEGTGLGLSTAYGIVRQSGGAVSVESVPGEGAAFRIYLPQHEGAVKVVQPAETAAQPPRVSGAILLVEDEETVRKMVRYTLEKKGCVVLEAADPWDAIRICEQHKGEISVAISDVIMPEMNGPDLAKRLTRLRPKMRLMFMSGYSDESLRERIEMEPGAAFLQKPFTTDQLLDALRKVSEETQNDCSSTHLLGRE